MINQLQSDQQKAFNRLEKAYKDCLRLNVFFVNRYGTLEAYDGDLVAGFGDNSMQAFGVKEVPVSEFPTSLNTISLPNEWADDDGCHHFGLTEKGLEVYKEDIEY